MRITAAVYKALSPILNEIKEDISSINHDIMAMKNKIGTLSNQTEEVSTRLSGLNESLRNDFSSALRELNSTTNMICGKIEEHDNKITTELMRMN